MPQEPGFPYEYGRDLHWLWSWGDVLQARLDDDRPPSDWDSMLFRPSALADDALTRLGTTYPSIIRQIQDCLDWTEKTFAEFLRVNTPDACEAFVDAESDLCRRIQVAVKTIADAEKPIPAIAMTPEERTMLEALADEHPMTVTQEALAAKTRLSEKTVRKYLGSLSENGLVNQPRGPKKGAGITASGLSAIGR